MKHTKVGIDYNMSFEDIALSLGISMSQVRYAYKQAMKKFRSKLNEKDTTKQ